MKSKAAWDAVVIAGMVLVGGAGMTRADVISEHPAGAQLADIFARPLPADFKPTGVDRAAYLTLIAGNVDFFKTCQNAAGAIIDPVSKGERQYSTPAFAAAAGVLVRDAGRSDLLEPASKALSCAITALVSKKAADNHADFYAPLLVHAYRFLKDVVPPAQAKTWADQLQKINPETMYRADLKGMNWNVVSSSGELLRRHDGLVADDRRAAQMTYLESCLAGHMKTLTPVGLFEDPGAPMAYDAFSRLWLEDVFADDAYAGGKLHEPIEKFLRTGGLSTLLLLSPTGEWPVGGRSGMHNWTDAEAAVICEINAAHWKKQGNDNVAGAFKRAAHLAFQSVARWQRPTGEIQIIKNHAEPQTRLAYEGYSNHSQYNLLPMAMLAIAYSRADDTIAERPSVSEAGGYVFDARTTFHKVVAAAGGYYVEIDTAGDPHYNATGLQRVHKAGVLAPALTDSSAPDRAFGDAKSPKAGLALGGIWETQPGSGKWIGLADFSGGKAKRAVTAADLKIEAVGPQRTAFTITYALAGDGGDGKTVAETYVLTSAGVDFTSNVNTPARRARLPVLVSDGAKDTKVDLSRSAVGVTVAGSTTTVTFKATDASADVKLEGPRIVDHSGYVQAATLGESAGPVTATITLTQK